LSALLSSFHAIEIQHFNILPEKPLSDMFGFQGSNRYPSTEEYLAGHPALRRVSR